MGAESVDSGMSAYQAEGGGAIPTSALHFTEIPWRIAKSFISEHHYLHTALKARIGSELCFGIFQDSSVWSPMIGAMVWGLPGGANRLRDGLSTLELQRMFILDVTTKNAESRAIGWAVRYIRKNRPSVTSLIAYSDIGGMGHKGTIYKAVGWLCEGETTPQSWSGGKGRSTITGSMTKKLRWRKVLRSMPHNSGSQ